MLAALKKMNLSESQKRQLQTLFDSAFKEFNQIIPPEQRSQFWQNIASKWEEKLEITPQQKEQLTQLGWQTIDQIKNTITTQQFVNFKTNIERTKDLKGAIEAMSLSESQKQQLGTVWESLITQFQEIIILEQRLEIRSELLSWWQKINSDEFWFPN
ncbi:MAG: hypothetical protein AB4038_00630 [Prochloraceae cyanobacterium]